MLEAGISFIKEIAHKIDRKNPIQFSELRQQTHERMAREIQERMQRNPVPTDIEVAIGAFIEELEPQVRDAIVTFYQKGYSTESSGFYGNYGEYQVIDGWFTIDKETKKKLRTVGAEVKGNIYTHVGFWPSEPNLDAIKEKWDLIAAMLPDTGHPASPSRSYGSEQFRRTFAKKS